MAEPVRVDGSSMTPAEVAAVARDSRRVELDSSAHAAVETGRERVETVLESGEAVYGVTTGFGHLVDTRIDPGDLEALQRNLLRSHAAGVGESLDVEVVRAMMLTRANALAKGFSGVRPLVIDRLLTLLNEEVHPVVPARGSLGASGDLAPLAQLALVLIGEGEAIVEGERVDGARALEVAGCAPLTLAPKEGLALINGTQLTLAIAALLVVDARRVLDAADVAGALSTEVTMGTTASADPALAAVRGHPGHTGVAQNLRRVTADSAVLGSHADCERVQDAYAIRCLPQVHGAVSETYDHLTTTVSRELNAATDNPLVFERSAVDDRAPGAGDAAVLSGGNFHGEPLTLPLESLQGGLVELATMSERRIDRLLNPELQEAHLPPFLARDAGLESGYMMAQYTSAALGTAARALDRPSQSNVPVSGNQEDHVSMSGESALRARETLQYVRRAIAAEVLCAVEASRYVDEELGVGTAAAVESVRSVLEPLDGDRPVGADIETVAEVIASGSLTRAVEDAIEEELIRTAQPPAPDTFR